MITPNMSHEDLRARASGYSGDDDSSAAGSGAGFQARSSKQENTETRFVHIPDPENYISSKPIDEAVNTAFDDAKLKDVSGVSPELIAQITQSVIQHLKTTGIGDTAQTPVTAIPATAPTQQSPTSPSVQDSPPRIYTPPSPQRPDVYESPLDRARTSPTIGRARAESGPNNIAGDYPVRPRQPRREPTVEETTTLEKIWGKLFDDEGQPTIRLGQFLRGLATHLIEDLEPKQSYVVTPKKMLDFYEVTQITNEKCPWHDVFDDDKSHISRMYRDLHIQHHLVQEDDRFNYKPDIPGLTARGFEKWQTMMIQAYPEEEFERLQKAVVNMPISNPDDKKERFPKDIPRRLFPKQNRSDIRDDLVEAIETHARIRVQRYDDTLTPKAEQPGPPQQQYSRRRVSDAASRASFTTEGSIGQEELLRRGSNEKEPKPYIRTTDSAIDDHLTPTISTPIERERKPYSAAPGGGKKYDDSNGAPLAHSNTYPAQASAQAPAAAAQPSLHRSISNSSSKAINIPPPPPSSASGFVGHRPSASDYALPLNNLHQAPHLREYPGSRRRNQSPLGNEMRRSDTDIRGFQSGSYESPLYMPREGYPPPPPPPGQFNQGDPRYDDDRRYGREGDLRRENYMRAGSPSRRNAGDQGSVNDRRGNSTGGLPVEEDYYRPRRERGW